MNLLRESSLALIDGLIAQLPKSDRVEVAVCPPNVYRASVATALQGRSIALSAQNMYHEKEGAFTGEASGPMLRDIGCSHVILGHSERRQLFGETDKSVNQKLLSALAARLTPIVCVGETLAEREAGDMQRIIDQQCRGSLADLTADQAAKIVVAYEPVWAIGTGKTATPEQAEEVHALIRKLLVQLFGQTTAEGLRILYGGSVKGENAAELLRQPNIDGALVGGASLKADGFAAIVKAAV